MTDTSQGPELTTDQIAGVSPRDAGDVEGRSPDLGHLLGSASMGGSVHGPSTHPTSNGDLPADDREEADQQQMQLLEADEVKAVREQWRQIQGEFVDEPRQAIHDADVLVADLMRRLARTLAQERDQLEAQLNNRSDVSTEDMRQGLRRYRAFFERLLAA